jgi:CRP/FNR family cyclic AMP-dependent transcriptional regulator
VSIFPTRFPDVPHDESNLPCLGQLKQLVSCKTFRVLPPQQVIFSQGESPHTVCLICSGLVKLTRTQSDGKRAIIGLRKTGWLLGAAALLPGLPYASTAETVQRSKLCFVSGDRFRNEMKTNASFSKWVSMIMSRGIYSSVISISEKGALSGRRRLEKFLWEMIQAKNNCNTGKALKVPIPLRLWELAQLLGLTPEYLSRLINKMEKEGVISRKNGWLILPEPKRLSYSGGVASDISKSK